MDTVDKAIALSDAPSPKVVGEPSHSSDDSGFVSREDSGSIVLSSSLSNEVTQLGSEDNVVIPPPLEFQDRYEDVQRSRLGSVGPYPTANRPQPPPSVRQPAAETEIQAPEECDPDANESNANCVDLTSKLQEKKSDKVLDIPKAIQNDYNMIRPTIEDDKVSAKIDQDFDRLTTEDCRNNIGLKFPPTTRDEIQDIDLDNGSDGEEVVTVERSISPSLLLDQVEFSPDQDLAASGNCNEYNETASLLDECQNQAAGQSTHGYGDMSGQPLIAGQYQHLRNGYGNGELIVNPYEDSYEIEARRRWMVIVSRSITVIMLLVWQLQIEVQRTSEDSMLPDWSLLPDQYSRSVVWLFMVKLFLLPVALGYQGEVDSQQQNALMLQEGPLIENIEKEKCLNLIGDPRDKQQQIKEEKELHNSENADDGLFSDADRDFLGLIGRTLSDAGAPNSQVWTCAAVEYIPHERCEHDGEERKPGPQPAPENMRHTPVEDVGEVVNGLEHDPGNDLSLPPLSRLIQHVQTVEYDIPVDEPTSAVDPPLSTLLYSLTLPPVLTGPSVAQVDINIPNHASILSDAERQDYDAAGARPRTHPPRPQPADVVNLDEEEDVTRAERRRRKRRRPRGRSQTRTKSD